MDLTRRLESVAATHAEMAARLALPEVLADPRKFRETSKALAELEPVVELYRRHRLAQERLVQAQELLASTPSDDELALLAAEEATTCEREIAALDGELRLALVPRDPDDERNVVLEVRAGTGGDEASLFAAELFRMYTRFAERKGWKVEVMDSSTSERNGLKEVVAQLSGPSVYRFLRYESGGHRVQRVPETETQGRIHTSVATVAVMPKAEEVDVTIKPEDVRIDTMRAGGPGGQKVNKIESAVRLTHIPSGIVVKCQDEKSQHKNKARAFEVLRTRLFEARQSKIDAERSAFRKNQVGSGDRSEKIRTYNFPQDRVTDHRAGETVHGIVRLMDGELDPLVDRLIAWDREIRLREMGAPGIVGLPAGVRPGDAKGDAGKPKE